MRITEFIPEARKNPTQNPKISGFQHIMRRFNNTNKKIQNIPNLFVSMTFVDKLGINPSSTYNTPVGIYSYPAIYVVDTVNTAKQNLNELPFVGNAPYINIFEASGNIIRLDNMKSNEFVSYAEGLAKFIHTFEVGEVDEVTNELIKDDFEDVKVRVNRLIKKAKANALVQSPGGQFWYCTKSVVDELHDYDSGFVGKSHAATWTMLFNFLGIHGCIDIGAGIIHSSEPTQAVFFNKRAIKNIERTHNKWSFDSELTGDSIYSFVKDNQVKINTIKQLAINKDVDGIYRELTKISGLLLKTGYLSDQKNTGILWLKQSNILRHLSSTEKASLCIKLLTCKQLRMSARIQLLTEVFDLSHDFCIEFFNAFSHNKNKLGKWLNTLLVKIHNANKKQYYELKKTMKYTLFNDSTLIKNHDTAVETYQEVISYIENDDIDDDEFDYEWLNTEQEYTAKPKLGAGCLFFAIDSDSRRYLIGKRSTSVNFSGTWSHWGGSLDENESPKTGAMREAAEETGFDFSGNNYINIKNLWTYQDVDSNDNNIEYHNFLVTVKHEFTPSLNYETADYAWVTKEELMNLTTSDHIHPGFSLMLIKASSKLPN